MNVCRFSAFAVLSTVLVMAAPGGEPQAFEEAVPVKQQHPVVIDIKANGDKLGTSIKNKNGDIGNILNKGLNNSSIVPFVHPSKTDKMPENPLSRKLPVPNNAFDGKSLPGNPAGDSLQPPGPKTGWTGIGGDASGQGNGSRPELPGDGNGWKGISPK